jgi:nicotinate-nucleotide pyrophosphorylase (carboxylating)
MLQDLVRRALQEDLGAGDLTTAAVVPEGRRARGRIDQKQPGVLAGLRVAGAVFAHIDPEVSFQALAPEGEWREPGQAAALEGAAHSILAGERVALNLLGRLSGVATLTARYVRAVEGTGVRILDTRKTTPGMRALEKEAVRLGGGTNHRMGLHDAVLVKENHAAMAGGVGEAARRALSTGRDGTPVEVECATLADIEEALIAGVSRILLDNMALPRLREAVELVAGRAELEASGGVTLENVRAIAEAGVDHVSVGALTHSAPALDVSLMLEPLA